MISYFWEEHGYKVGISLIIAAVVVLLFSIFRNDRRRAEEINRTCYSYLADSRNHSDSLHARMACDVLRAGKRAEDAADAAAAMAASASTRR